MNFLKLSTHKEIINKNYKEDIQLQLKKKKLIIRSFNNTNYIPNKPIVNKPIVNKYTTDFIKLVNKYPFLLHKYRLNLIENSDNLSYEVINSNILKHNLDNNTQLLCHIHLFYKEDIKNFGNILSFIKKNFLLIVTYVDIKNKVIYENNQDIMYDDIFFLNVKNKGNHIGGMLCFLDYIYKNDIDFKNILFLNNFYNDHDNNINFIFNEAKFEKIKILLNYYDLLCFDNIYNGDCNLEKNYFLNNIYYQELCDFLNIKNNTFFHINNNVCFCSKKIITRIFNKTNIELFYKILNTPTSFDYNWCRFYYDKKEHSINNVYEFVTKNKLSLNYFNHMNKPETNNINFLKNTYKFNSSHILKNATIEHTFEKMFINTCINEELKYLNVNKNLINEEIIEKNIISNERFLCIDYHCYSREYFSLESIGKIIEGLYILNYLTDIHITFINEINETDNIIIELLKNTYNKFKTNIYIHTRNNSGADLKTIFTTMDYCKKNNLNYKWFYHTHTKQVQTVTKDNIAFYNKIENVIDMVSIFTQKLNVSIFGSGLQCTLNILEYSKGVLVHFKDVLNKIKYKSDINLSNVFNTAFFGGNIYICNFTYLKKIIDSIDIHEILNLMLEPNTNNDNYWTNLMISRFFSHTNKNLTNELYKKNYLCSGDCYSNRSLSLGLHRDYTVMHVLERLIPLLLQQYGDIYCYGRKSNSFDKEIYVSRHKDLSFLSESNIKKHFNYHAFIEGRIAEKNIYNGIYKFKICYPVKDYIYSILPYFKNDSYDSLKNKFNNYELLNYVVGKECNGDVHSAYDLTYPYINLNNINTFYKNVFIHYDEILDDYDLNDNNSILFNLKNYLAVYPDVMFLKILNEPISKHYNIFLHTNKRFIQYINPNNKSEYDTYLNATNYNAGDVLYDIIFTYKNEKKINILLKNKYDNKDFTVIYSIRYLLQLIKNKKMKNFSMENNIIMDLDAKEKFEFMRKNNNILKNIYLKLISYMIDLNSYKNSNRDLKKLSNDELFIHLNNFGFNEKRCINLKTDYNDINIPEIIFENNNKYKDFCLTLLSAQTGIDFINEGLTNNINTIIKNGFKKNRNSIVKLPNNSLRNLTHFVFNKENYSYVFLKFNSQKKFKCIKDILLSFKDDT
jgi:hypothetical protein